MNVLVSCASYTLFISATVLVRRHQDIHHVSIVFMHEMLVLVTDQTLRTGPCCCTCAQATHVSALIVLNELFECTDSANRILLPYSSGGIMILHEQVVLLQGLHKLIRATLLVQITVMLP